MTQLVLGIPQLVRRTRLNRRGISVWCCALLLAGVSAAAASPAAAAIPVEESVGTMRDGAQRPASAPPGTMAGPGGADRMAGAVAQGTPWSSAEPDTQTFGSPRGGGGGGSGGVAIAQRAPVAAAPASSVQPGQHSEMFYQMQVLQQEVQDLRGLVEELTHQLNRLASDQQDQYRDVDRRLQALRGGDGAVPRGMTDATGAAETLPGGAAGAGPAAGAAGSAAAPAAALGEREAYSAAFELMRARKFPESTAAFTRFVRDYPSGGYTANAFYWLGELYLAQDDLERARQSFTQVLNLYPDHQKIPDALYKLGVVHHRIGDVGRAREFLNRAVSQHAGSSAAALAQTYLSELQ